MRKEEREDEGDEDMKREKGSWEGCRKTRYKKVRANSKFRKEKRKDCRQ